MKSRLVLAAAVSAVLLAPAAFAAGNTTGPSAKAHNVQVAAMTPAEQCTALEGQWQKDGTAMSKNSKYAAAEKLATQGRQLCTEGKPVDGVAKLGQALRDLGLKPKA